MAIREMKVKKIECVGTNIEVTTWESGDVSIEVWHGDHFSTHNFTSEEFDRIAEIVKGDKHERT